MLLRRRRSALVLILATLIAASSAYVSAQFPQGLGGLRGEQGDPPEFPPKDFPDSDFVTCRMLYTSVRREANGAGWRTDYPWGERHLMIRLSELTKTRVSFLSKEVPHAWLVRLTDQTLFQCPFLVASDVGTVGLSPIEAERLREYLLKGGFLWVDDFWGDAAWEQWSREIGRALPASEFAIEDVSLEDPIFHSMMEVEKVPQITSIRFWRASGGRSTSERGDQSAVAHFRGIRDQHGRLMVVMTHNTDVADSWEREGEDPEFFYQFSPDGYALGINVALYALTH
ncbi:MAG: DUF4159 domain-containing protein [Vicinamibacterales bacterium]